MNEIKLTSTEKLKAHDLKAFVSRERIKATGSAADYITVYRDFCRNDGDYSATYKTRIYIKNGGEFCTLMEVLAWYYRDHQRDALIAQGQAQQARLSFYND